MHGLPGRIDGKFGRFTMGVAVVALALFGASSHAQVATTGKPAATACSAAIVAALKSTAKGADKNIAMNCSITLNPGDVISGNMSFIGPDASGAVVDCKGGAFKEVPGAPNVPLITVKSIQNARGQWLAPTDVTIRNCVLEGDVQVYGLGPSANDPIVRASSMNKDHTAFAQMAAPTRIIFDGNTFSANGGTPLYVGPGVTNLAVENSKFVGWAKGVAVYLDAESAHNRLVKNDFSFQSRTRELIAIDGSAHNTVSRNTFNNPVLGGIFLYRNCGEAGTIRHQTPAFNIIDDNRFVYDVGSSPKPAVYINSRKGRSKMCFSDPAHPFGSSLSPMDFAKNNKVERNTLVNGKANLIDNDDSSNTVDSNTFSK